MKYRMSARFFEGFPLHKKVLLENEKKDLSFMTHTSGDRSLGHSFNSQDAKKIIDVVRLVNTPVEKNQIIFEIIEEEACAFFAGEKSFDAAAEEIANRLSLYYLEHVVRLVNTPVEKNQIIFEIIEEEACAFFAGEKSFDAAAEEIANRLSLYYLEQ